MESAYVSLLARVEREIVAMETQMTLHSEYVSLREPADPRRVHSVCFIQASKTVLNGLYLLRARCLDRIYG
ncbi:hypothetical protein SAMN05444168_4713 [Paraburkholderia phenazinium]|uniref:Uncharacterized protein n=1 Tax=Paraburkholderia phenazinium TaxID=60549 RepID=A0A1N6JN48_9BURK|nr:hypothetical protein SAMN05444168_4713 [Paraburkholderia phenazinium]